MDHPVETDAQTGTILEKNHPGSEDTIRISTDNPARTTKGTYETAIRDLLKPLLKKDVKVTFAKPKPPAASFVELGPSFVELGPKKKRLQIDVVVRSDGTTPSDSTEIVPAVKVPTSTTDDGVRTLNTLIIIRERAASGSGCPSKDVIP